MAWKHMTRADEDALIELYVNYSMTQIEELTGVSKGTVREVLVRRGVPRRKRSAASASFRKVNPSAGPDSTKLLGKSHFLIMRHLYEEREMSQDEIAEKLGMSRGGVQRRLQTLGIPRRAGRRKGRKVGPYDWKVKLPRCATPECGTGVRGKDEAWCSLCRRRPGRRKRLGSLV